MSIFSFGVLDSRLSFHLTYGFYCSAGFLLAQTSWLKHMEREEGRLSSLYMSELFCLLAMWSQEHREVPAYLEALYFPVSKARFWCLVALLPLGSEFVTNRAEMPSPRHCALRNFLLVTTVGVERVAAGKKAEEVLARHFSCTDLGRGRCAHHLCTRPGTLHLGHWHSTGNGFVGHTQVHCTASKCTGASHWALDLVLCAFVSKTNCQMILPGFGITFIIKQFIIDWIVIIPHCYILHKNKSQVVPHNLM